MFNEQNGKRVLKRTNKMINNWHECAGWPRWISFEFTCFINYYTIHLHIQYENYLFSRSGIITIHILTRCCTGISSALGTSLLDATRTDQHCWIHTFSIHGVVCRETWEENVWKKTARCTSCTSYTLVINEHIVWYLQFDSPSMKFQAVDSYSLLSLLIAMAQSTK